VRYDNDGNALAVVANFAGGPHNDFVLGLPHAGEWVEAFNSDALEYGGSGVGNLGVVHANGDSWNGLPASATVTLPPLGVLFLTRAAR
jgi:1,4-alpha-glucan branching enzyme